MAVVYRHIRKDKNQPFYIGIGNEKRPYKKSDRNNYWNSIVKKTDYEVEILFDNLTWEEASEKEIEFIKLYGRKDNGTGILANMTDGGEGSLGTKVTQETRRKMSEKRIGSKNANSKSVYCSFLNKQFDTISDCALELNVSQPFLSRMLKGQRYNKFGVTYMPKNNI